MERTLFNLMEAFNGNRIYIFLTDDSTKRLFTQSAITEGFTFGDGAATDTRELDSIMALNGDHTINYVGINGHVAFGVNTSIGGKPLIRIDYQRYIHGEENYYIGRH